MEVPDLPVIEGFTPPAGSNQEPWVFTSLDRREILRAAVRV
jgi:hypothetical protein